MTGGSHTDGTGCAGITARAGATRAPFTEAVFGNAVLARDHFRE
ncbi:hypothetical protein ACFQ1I_12205 [Kitasatospora arboriphila]